MSSLACAICHRDDLWPRWIGGMLAAWCEYCGNIYILDREPLRREPEHSAGSNPSGFLRMGPLMRTL